MSGIEGIGEAVTGGMLARAVEPGAGEAVHGHGEGGVCLNCGATLLGEYCHRCGQAGHVHRSLTAFFHDLLHGVFHFEGKIWHTLPMLAFRPGELTRRYIAGERARFVSPIALFLFTVFLMFAVFSWIGAPFAVKDQGAATDQEEALGDLQKQRLEGRADLKEAEADLAEARADGSPTATAESRVAEIKRDLAVTEQAYRIASSFSTAAAAKEKAEGKPEPKEKEQHYSSKLVDIDTGWLPLDHAIQKANENPSLLLYKLKSNAYKFSWALIPISVPFVWLMLFWKRRYKLYDHTVFVTYSIAFMSFGVILLSLMGRLGVSAAITGLAIAFVPPIHMFAQLRGAYGLSRFGALWRTFFLLMFAFIAGTFFFVMLLAMGLAG